jgi:hypothetical protein
LTRDGRSRYDDNVRFYNLLATLGVVAVLGVASPAWAIDENAARQHFEQATDAFSKGRYDDAVREYLLAYRASNDSSLLFNVAQSHRLAGHYSAALQYYRMYLQNQPDASDRKEVEKQIKEMEKRLEKEASHTPAPRPSTPGPSTVSPPTTPPPMPPPSATPPGENPTVLQPSLPELSAPAAEAQPAASGAPEKPLFETPPPEPPSLPTEASPYHARAKIIAGAVTLAAGVALAATGIAMGVDAKNTGDQLTSDNHNGVPFDASKESHGKLDEVLEGVFLGVGCAAAITGAAVLGLGVKEYRAAKLAVAPSISPNGAAALVTVRY